MPVTLDLYRFPLEEAVEAISYRTPNVGSIEEGLGARSAGLVGPFRLDFTFPERPPQGIALETLFGYAYDAFVGTAFGTDPDRNPFFELRGRRVRRALDGVNGRVLYLLLA